jgi:GNAT superfamily N-acetyltransferase
VFSLRPMQATDHAFTYQVFASTRLDEMAQVDWPPEQKDVFLHMQFELRERQYCSAYPEAVRDVILCDDVPAGSMITLRTAEATLLVDISLLPDFRHSGIGTAILRNLQAEGKKVILHVLRHNPAVHLYSRMGFVSVAEDSMYLRMEWNPQ